MSKGCIAASLFIVFALLFVFELVVVVFVVPINAQCDFNSWTDPEVKVALTMEQWIYGGMGAGIVMFALFCGSSRTKSDSDCWMGFLTLVFALYHIF